MITSGCNSGRLTWCPCCFRRELWDFRTLLSWLFLKFIPTYEQRDYTGVSTMPFMTTVTAEKLVFELRTFIFYCGNSVLISHFRQKIYAFFKRQVLQFWALGYAWFSSSHVKLHILYGWVNFCDVCRYFEGNKVIFDLHSSHGFSIVTEQKKNDKSFVVFDNFCSICSLKLLFVGSLIIEVSFFVF